MWRLLNWESHSKDISLNEFKERIKKISSDFTKELVNNLKEILKRCAIRFLITSNLYLDNNPLG